MVGFLNFLRSFSSRQLSTYSVRKTVPNLVSTFDFTKPLPFQTVASQQAVYEAEKAQFYRENPPVVSYSYSAGFTGDAYAQKLLNSGTQNLVISHYKRGKAVYALQTVHIDQKPFTKTFNPTLTRL